MPVHPEHSWVALCDECDWGTDPLPFEDQAQELLDRHIRDKH